MRAQEDAHRVNNVARAPEHQEVQAGLLSSRVAGNGVHHCFLPSCITCYIHTIAGADRAANGGEVADDVDHLPLPGTALRNNCYE